MAALAILREAREWVADWRAHYTARDNAKALAVKLTRTAIQQRANASRGGGIPAIGVTGEQYARSVAYLMREAARARRAVLTFRRLRVDRDWPATWQARDASGMYWTIEAQRAGGFAVGCSVRAGDVDCIARGMRYYTREEAELSCLERVA